MKRLLGTSIGVALVGATLGCSASTSGGPHPSATPPDPDFITTAEVESQPFRDAYDIVQRLRPTWFTKKSGTSSARRMGVSGGRSAIGAGLLVYLDNARLGGVEVLRQLSANAIESLRFVDAATATATLPGIGSSVVSGAIVVRMQRAQPAP